MAPSPIQDLEKGRFQEPPAAVGDDDAISDQIVGQRGGVALEP